MPPVKVFLVDDYPLVRAGTRRLLEMDTRVLVVGEAETGEEACDGIPASGARVILMDIRLPGMDGIATTRRLTTLDPELRVVVLSGFGGNFLAPAIEAGACGYILKSAAPSELVQAVLRAADGQSPVDASLGNMLLTSLLMKQKRPQSGSLTTRQREILGMVASGMSSKEIEAQVFVSEATVKRELRNVFDFLDVNDRAHAVSEAYKRNLL